MSVCLRIITKYRTKGTNQKTKRAKYRGKIKYKNIILRTATAIFICMTCAVLLVHA